ncbi:anti-sigma factor family protein [Halopseudomonas salegens]|uniref:Zinc-finger domain-containing protein n=1 Tax=Halopseudomonas salegens TaxID=1434072 RepID=A0A1H2FJE4_9GAMM|nr:hypothetical protein [Halopseudomonas salegens]SDU07451.1 hypothetical protein SAMN05216210_1605 [Halopseudomonas salegens]
MMMTRLDAEKLLPFYLNGTLTEGEVEAVEHALTDYPELQQELDFLRALRKHLKSQPAAANSPGEMGLKRLQQQLHKPQPASTARSVRGWHIAAIAASFLLLAQTAIVLKVEQPADYYPAGGAVDGQAGGTAISITFAPETTEQQIRAVLLASNSRIVDGPSALGIYRILVQDEADGTIAWLKEQDIIDSLQVQ